jgi:hypothetical protein
MNNPELLPRITSVLTWIYGYAEGLAQSEDPKIADIGRELLRALHEGKS